METDEAVETLRRVVRRELMECERAIRDRDPVRALNDLTDAARQLNALADRLESERDAAAS